MVEKVSKGEVIAFRLGASGLLERAAASELPDVAGRCGIQNSPPGSALLALHARVQGMTQELLDAAFVEEWAYLLFYYKVFRPLDLTSETHGQDKAEQDFRAAVMGLVERLTRQGVDLAPLRPVLLKAYDKAAAVYHRTDQEAVRRVRDMLETSPP